MIPIPDFRPPTVGLVAALVVAVTLAVPSSVYACQVGGWTMSEVASRAAVIVEGDVAAVLPGGGYELSIRRVHKGANVGKRLTIGTATPTSMSDCAGRVSLAAGDHVLIAFTDPDTALAFETPVWWIQPDGVIEQRSLVHNDGPTSLESVIAALHPELPDTATLPVTRSVDGDDRFPILVVSLLAGLLVVVVRTYRPMKPTRAPDGHFPGS